MELYNSGYNYLINTSTTVDPFTISDYLELGGANLLMFFAASFISYVYLNKSFDFF